MSIKAAVMLDPDAAKIHADLRLLIALIADLLPGKEPPKRPTKAKKK